MQLMILNTRMKAVGILDNRLPHACPYSDDVHHEKLEHGFRTLEFKVPASHPTSALLETEGYVVYPNDDGRLELFIIQEIKDVRQGGSVLKEIFCENSAVGELNNCIMRPTTMNSVGLDTALTQVLNGTGWSVGDVERISLRDFKFEDYDTVLSTIHEVVKSFDAEINFEVKMAGGKITERLVHAKAKRGQDTKKLFRYSQDISGVTKTTDAKQIVTALIGIGKADSNGNILTFQNIMPTLEDGFERGSDWIGSLEAVQKYGIDGKHRFGIYKDENATTASELFEKTLAELKKLSKPLVNYSVDVVLLEKVTGLDGHKVRIGDTIRVQDEQLGVLVEARIIERKVTRSEKGKDSVVLGEFIPIIPSPRRVISRIENILQRNESVWSSGIVNADRVQGGTLSVGGDSGTVIETKETNGTEEVPVGYINNKEANLEKVTAAVIESPSVVNRNDDTYTIYVDPKNGSDGNNGLASDSASALATLGEAFKRIPKHNDGKITVSIVGSPGTWREEAVPVLGGISGSGSIIVDFGARTNILESQITILNCTQPISFWNGTMKNNTVWASNRYEGVINFHNCSWTHLKNFYFDAVTNSNLMYSISVTGSSFARIEDCEAYNGEEAQIRVQEGAVINLYKTASTTGGCKGSGGTYGIFAAYGGIVSGIGDCPTGTSSNLYVTLGAIANTTPTYNSGTKPTQTGTTTTTTEWTATLVDSYRPNYGWRGDSSFRQGQYSSYGNHLGFTLFNHADIKTKLTGKTIKSVQLYMERQSGGSNSEQPINLYYHELSSKPSSISSSNLTLVKSNAGTYAIGTTGKKWITVPNSLATAFQGNAKGIAIYASSGSPYMVFNNVIKLKITYEG